MFQVVKLLLKANDDVARATDFNGNTPLHFAASNGHAEVAEILMGALDHLNAQNAR